MPTLAVRRNSDEQRLWRAGGRLPRRALRPNVNRFIPVLDGWPTGNVRSAAEMFAIREEVAGQGILCRGVTQLILLPQNRDYTFVRFG